MNKGLVLITILAVMLFLTGCSGQTQTVGRTFIGGTEGLKTSFVTGNPPDITTDGGTGGFSIAVKLENIGEYTIGADEGYVQILGIDGVSFNLDPSITDFKKTFNQQTGFGTNLRGAVMNFDGKVLNGGISTVDFGQLKYMPVVQGPQEAHIEADVCYKYKTEVSTQICVKNDVEQALSSDKICSVEGEKNPQNSGGPIQVTSLKESYAGNGFVGLSLTLTHSGSGDNFFKDGGKGVAPSCIDKASNPDTGKVRIQFDPVQVSGKKMPVICQSTDADGYIKLYSDGSGKETYTLYCTVDVSGSNNVVEVPLSLNVSYVYLQHVDTQMTVRHVGQ